MPNPWGQHGFSAAAPSHTATQPQLRLSALDQGDPEPRTRQAIFEAAPAATPMARAYHQRPPSVALFPHLHMQTHSHTQFLFHLCECTLVPALPSVPDSSCPPQNVELRASWSISRQQVSHVMLADSTNDRGHRRLGVTGITYQLLKNRDPSAHNTEMVNLWCNHQQGPGRQGSLGSAG